MSSLRLELIALKILKQWYLKDFLIERKVVNFQSSDFESKSVLLLYTNRFYQKMFLKIQLHWFSDTVYKSLF